MTKQEKRRDMIRLFAQAAREAHRRGDVTARARAEENIRELASRAEAKKVIAGLYTN